MSGHPCLDFRTTYRIQSMKDQKFMPILDCYLIFLIFDYHLDAKNMYTTTKKTSKTSNISLLATGPC